MQPEARLDKQTDPAETASESRATGGLALIPVFTVALGAPAQSIERLMALQSAIARVVDLLATSRLSWPRPVLPAWLRARMPRGETS